MKQYVLKGNNNECSFWYTEGGNLCQFKAEPDMNIEALEWLLKHLPITYNQLIELAEFKKLEVVEIPMNLSFEWFWENYNHKIGGKDRAKKLWEKLSDADKVKALIAIPRYDRYLKVKSGIEKAYPETYLSQRRFENIFK